MTITSTATSVAYTGNGSTTIFSVTFAFFGTGPTAELRVIERVIATGVETVKTNVTDYTVTGGSGSTGTVTAVTAPASTVQWIIERNTTKTQETDYTANDPFPAETHEAALDRVTAIAQETDADASRALRFPVTDSSALSAEIPNSVARASAFLAFDASGEPIASTGPTGDSSIPVSTFMETVLDDADAATARATLVAQQDVITTRGDIVIGNSTPAASRLAVGSTGQFLTTDGTDVSWGNPPGLPRSYLAGLGLSNDTDADHDILMAVGECRNATNDGDITIASALTKQIDATWAAGDDAGGRASGVSLSNTTWYHFFALASADGATVDAGFDTSLTAANLLADAAVVSAGLTKYRRIGSVRTDGSANILAFAQWGDRFFWDVPVSDLSNSTIGTAGTTLTLTVPTGVVVLALFNASQGTAADALLFYQPGTTGVQPGTTSPPIGQAGGAQAGGEFHDAVQCLTNTSAQVIGRSSAANTDSSISTMGWLDRRGRDD